MRFLGDDGADLEVPFPGFRAEELTAAPEVDSSEGLPLVPPTLLVESVDAPVPTPERGTPVIDPLAFPTPTPSSSSPPLGDEGASDVAGLLSRLWCPLVLVSLGVLWLLDLLLSSFLLCRCFVSGIRALRAGSSSDRSWPCYQGVNPGPS